MKYLHSYKILFHRDLKPANILLDKYLFPKLADFGLSKLISKKYVHQKNEKISSGLKGTYAYCAPEILRSCEYSKKSDVYAFGLFVYEIMTNDIIYEDLNFYKLLIQVPKGYRPEFKTPIPKSYKKLICNCWSGDISERPSFQDIVQSLEIKSGFKENVDIDAFYEYVHYINKTKPIMNNETPYFDVEQFISQQYSSQSLPQKNQVQLEFVNDEDDIDFKQYNQLFLDLSKFERVKMITKGSFSKIYKLKEKENEKIYQGQVSTLKINKITQNDIDLFVNEIKIIKEIEHPCLLKFIGYSPLDFKKHRKPVIVTEFASKVTLEDIIEIERSEKEIQGWPETKKLIVIYGIASGMSYLHSKGIIHRSISPCNIFLDDFLNPKIGDFGLSTRFSISESLTHQSISGMRGTPIYTAPEVLKNNKFSKASDVYSFAIIFYEVMTNEIPFKEIESENKIVTKIVDNGKRPIFNKKLPSIYKNLIEKCWSNDPQERPSFKEITLELRRKKEFLTDQMNENDFTKYVSYIDENTKIKIEEIEG